MARRWLRLFRSSLGCGSSPSESLCQYSLSITSKDLPRIRTVRTRLIFVALLMPALAAGFTQVAIRTIPLDAAAEIQSFNVKAERVTYNGRAALRVTDTAAANVPDGERL